MMAELRGEGLIDEHGSVTELGLGIGERELAELARVQPAPTQKRPR